jgi:sugar phosphate isomerase/epimerase
MAVSAAAKERPRFAHRQASMQRPGPDVFAFAHGIRGLGGIELQVFYRNTTLHDAATLSAYKTAARDSGLVVPSIAGIWEKGVGLTQPRPAESSIRRAIDVAHALGAGVILIASFRDNCPRMDQSASFEPVVAMLRKLAPVARSAGVTLALETSLSPSDDRKLVDLVADSAVKVYYDAHNTESYGHTGQSVSGVSVLTRSRIAQVHCKNEDRLLEAQGLVNWSAMFPALRDADYSGWFTFETRHTGPEECVAETARNIEFARKLLTASPQQR